MHTKYLFLLSMALISAAVMADTRMRVTADSVNMRAKPNDTVETVKPQLNKGDQVMVRNIVGDWAEIVPPRNADLYVYGEFVRDGSIQVSKLRVRSGPSISYKDVGMVNKGDKVVERGTFGEWVKIAPPPQTSLWVSTEYLEKASKPVEKQEKIVPTKPIAEEKAADQSAAREKPRERRPPPPTRRPIKPIMRSVEGSIRGRPVPTVDERREAETAASAPAPADLDLIPLEGQGSMTEIEGILRSTGLSLFSRAPAKYRLVVMRGNGFKTICYVKGNERQLNSFSGKPLKIKGRQYWVRGEDVPVIVPTQIIP